jgi:hypothetical protein
MESSTDTNAPNKRTRFDLSASDGTSTTVKSSKSPMAAATQHVQAHVASLQPQIATILSRLAKQYLLLLSKLHHKTRQLETMQTDPSFIPRSARIDFALSVTKKAEQDAEFPALRDECTRIITETQQSLKNQIVLATTVEIKLFRTDTRELLANSLQVITKAFLIADGHSPAIQPERMVNTLLDRYHETLLSHLDCSLAEFRRIYCALHSLASLPDPYPQSQPARAAADATDHSDSLFMTVAQQQQIRNAAAHAPATRTTEDTVASSLKRTLESIFITSWTLYLRQSETNTIDLALKKLSIEHFDSKATEAAIMEIDMEPPASRQQLDGLIRASVSKQTKKLQNEIQTLKAGLAKVKLPAKNTMRGSTTQSSASRKKKSPGTAPPAAAPANATSTASDRTNKGKSKQRSSGKKKGSNRPKTTNARRSTSASP